MKPTIFFLILAAFMASKAESNNHYEREIISAAQETGVSPDLIRAMMVVESSENPNAVSSVGAVGLMQLTVDTAKKYGVSDRTNPSQSIKGGARYLKHLNKVFKNDTALVAAAYNAGEFAVKRYHGVPPYKETRQHVRKVLREIERI